MNTEDFLELKAGQIIYHKGIQKSIRALRIDSDHNYDLRFNGEEYYNFWIGIKDDCSLEAPKEKRKYFQWIVKSKSTGRVCTTNELYNDNGFNIEGIQYTDWDRIEKKKIESIFWEE